MLRNYAELMKTRSKKKKKVAEQNAVIAVNFSYMNRIVMTT